MKHMIVSMKRWRIIKKLPKLLDFSISHPSDPRLYLHVGESIQFNNNFYYHVMTSWNPPDTITGPAAFNTSTKRNTNTNKKETSLSVWASGKSKRWGKVVNNNSAQW